MLAPLSLDSFRATTPPPSLSAALSKMDARTEKKKGIMGEEFAFDTSPISIATVIVSVFCLS